MKIDTARGTFSRSEILTYVFSNVGARPSAMAKLPADADGSRGVLINVASVAGIEGQKGQVVYSASKGAMMRLTESLAGEWARDGIRVNTIAPGAFITDAQSFVLGNLVNPVLEIRIRSHSIETPTRAFEVVDVLVGRKSSTKRPGQFDRLAVAVSQDPAGHISPLAVAEPVFAGGPGLVVFEEAVPRSDDQDVRENDDGEARPQGPTRLPAESIQPVADFATDDDQGDRQEHDQLFRSERRSVDQSTQEWQDQPEQQQFRHAMPGLIG